MRWMTASRISSMPMPAFALASSASSAGHGRLPSWCFFPVEQLILRVSIRDRSGRLQKPIRERRLPVIDVGDDAEIARAFDGHCEPGTMRARAGRVNRAKGIGFAGAVA